MSSPRYVGEEVTVSMRVLLVEDEEATIKQIQKLLEEECQASVELARSRNTALQVLERNEDFDLIICDLRIPTQDHSLDVAEDHGLRVYDVARDKHPGTFSRFFSGYAKLENIGDRLASGPSLDVYSTGEPWALVDIFPKSRQPEFIHWAAELSRTIQSLDQLDVHQSGSVYFMNDYEARTLRIFARRLGGSQIVASSIGGLSAATVLRVNILDEASASVGLVVAKVDNIVSIEDELTRYSLHVAPILGVGTFAPLAGEVLHGCGRLGAAFYSLASNGYADLFELSSADEAQSEQAITYLRESHSRWRGNQNSSSVSVASLRSVNISGQEFAPWIDELGAGRVGELEASTVSLSYSIQHGDLHGLNVLVDAEGRPLIIDYGTLGQHPSALDPVTLELSFVFHAEHPELRAWPSVDEASRWFDLHHYSRASPFGRTINACRQWALSVATRRQLAAVVYAHATRQLKYEDTTKPLALAIARAAMAILIDE